MAKSQLRLFVPIGFLAALLVSAFSTACRPIQNDLEPVITFSVVPVADDGGTESMELIKGSALHVKPTARVVLYVYTFGNWWLQPFISHPFTEIKVDSTWQTLVHLGHQYAALVVDNSYKPHTKLLNLPIKGDGVLGIVTAPGMTNRPQVLRFSGYDWEIRQLSSNWGGHLNAYDPANAWVDPIGHLHLRMVRVNDGWSCADVRLTESLGQGFYRFTVRDISKLDPAADLRMHTWERSTLFNRELGIDISRWENPGSKNARFVVSPSYQPNNLHRFEAPGGVLTFSFQWEPGTISFQAIRGRATDRGKFVARHTFTSGVPAPGGESIHISLYPYWKSHVPMKQPAEVIIESFEYAP
jgi:hypothetical protein